MADKERLLGAHDCRERGERRAGMEEVFHHD